MLKVNVAGLIYRLINPSDLLRVSHISDMTFFFQAELNKAVTQNGAVESGLPTDGKTSPEKHHSLLLEVSALSTYMCICCILHTYLYMLGFPDYIVALLPCCHIV